MTSPARGRLVDWRAALDGAAVAVLVTLPPTVAVQLFKGDDLEGQESNLWVVPVVAMLAGFFLAGRRAARRRPEAPLVHGAAAAALAIGALAALTVVRRLVAGDGIGAPLVVTMILLAQVTVSVGVLGGYTVGRSRR
ncbi:MAG TPA: hypothetical protein VM264_12140 [Acidimicrobiales bacterium]|nr:hypothetical protein [Acidimicrobiales bacterium]